MAILIKRYENRKLYDTEQKRYVSLEEIAALVRQEQEIRVVDNVSGDDLTAQTLTKILMEEGQKGTRNLPKAFLHELVRWGDKVKTSTVDQFEQRLDQLVQLSLERLDPLQQVREEMAELRSRVEKIEAALGPIEGRGQNAPSPPEATADDESQPAPAV